VVPTIADAQQASPADILAIEQRTWRTRGAKADAILDLLGLTETRYYQVLNHVIDTPEALGAAPALVNRLRARRASRLARRTGQSNP
jgi:Protein of unknown function (DUF3263)